MREKFFYKGKFDVSMETQATFIVRFKQFLAITARAVCKRQEKKK